ncbi:hypothetical protein BOTBODRAFT_180519, partial [Botryobasidium botryosum FD-172 SS1]
MSPGSPTSALVTHTILLSKASDLESNAALTIDYMQNNPYSAPPPGGGQPGPIRSSSRAGHRAPSPSPYARPQSEDGETVPDSQDETIRLPAPPSATLERDRQYFEKAIRDVSRLARVATEPKGSPYREPLIRAFLGAIISIAEQAGLAPLLSLLRNHPDFGEIVTAIETEAVELWASTHPMPPSEPLREDFGIFAGIPSGAAGKAAEDNTPARLSAIEKSLAE